MPQTHCAREPKVAKIRDLGFRERASGVSVGQPVEVSYFCSPTERHEARESEARRIEKLQRRSSGVWSLVSWNLAGACHGSKDASVDRTDELGYVRSLRRTQSTTPASNHVNASYAVVFKATQKGGQTCTLSFDVGLTRWRPLSPRILPREEPPKLAGVS